MSNSLQPHELQHARLPCSSLSLKRLLVYVLLVSGSIYTRHVLGRTCHFKNRPNQLNFVQSLSPVQLSVTPWTAAHQASLSFTISWSLFRLMCNESAITIQPSHPLSPFSSCLQSFPASESFPMSQIFTSGGQSIGVSASASVLPVNIQD